MGAHLTCYNIITNGGALTPYLFDKLGPKLGRADHAICYGYKFPHSNWHEVLEHCNEATELMHMMGANTIGFITPQRPRFHQVIQRVFTKTFQIG